MKSRNGIASSFLSTRNGADRRPKLTLLNSGNRFGPCEEPGRLGAASPEAEQSSCSLARQRSRLAKRSGKLRIFHSTG